MDTVIGGTPPKAKVALTLNIEEPHQNIRKRSHAPFAVKKTPLMRVRSGQQVLLRDPTGREEIVVVDGFGESPSENYMLVRYTDNSPHPRPMPVVEARLVD